MAIYSPEIWKEAKSISEHGKFEVSSLGRVRSLNRVKPIIMKPSKTGGYLGIAIGKRPNRKFILVHRLVMTEFIPNKFNKSDVNHINGKRDDNRLENLEWNTRQENLIHSLKRRNGRSNSAKLSEANVRFIKENKGLLTCKEFGALFGVNASTVNHVHTGYNW